MNPRSVWKCCVAEALGTWMIVFFGCGAVHVAVLTSGLTGLWQVGIVWGLAIMMAIYVTVGVSGAHLNPAVTLGLAFWKQFDRTRVVPYIASQFVGAFLAAAALFVLFSPHLVAKERELGVIRGKPGSEITAMCYGEYFPNPGGLLDGAGGYSEQRHAEFNLKVPELQACFAEVLGTMLLLLVICAVTDLRNPNNPEQLAPAFIGLTVTALICVLAPLTQACFNPARDFGPRVFAFLAGWGAVALPGGRPTGFLTVYLISPVVGAISGIGLYRSVISPALFERTEKGAGK